MPKLTDTLPKYRKHRATGQAVVTLSSRDFYLGHHGTKTSRLEYDRLIGEWLANGRQSLRGTTDELSVAELCLRYLKHARVRYVKNGCPTSEQAAILSAIRFLRRTYSNQPASSFGPLALKAVRSDMVEANLAITTINQHVGRIRRMFRWGVAEELVRSEVYQALAALPGLRRSRGEARETKPVLPVDDAIVSATLTFLPDVVADMVRFQRYTGCRPAEVCILRPCDVDRSEDVWRYTPESHKCEHHGRDRVVCLGPRTQIILLRYLDRDSQDYCFRPADSEAKRRAAAHANRKTPLSCGTKPGDRRKRKPKRPVGTRYNTGAYRRAIARACEKAGLSRWSPNQLRHTAGTEFRREFGVEASRVMLGHSKISTTEIYSEQDYGLAMKVARKLG